MTREQLQADDEARRRAFAYMDGFGVGASGGECDRKYDHDADFNAGWAAGREAKKIARQHAERTYGHTFAVLRPA
jgi:hypothetical protein